MRKGQAGRAILDGLDDCCPLARGRTIEPTPWSASPRLRRPHDLPCCRRMSASSAPSTAPALPMPSMASGHPSSSYRAGSAICGTTGRARFGGTSWTTSGRSPRSSAYDERGFGMSDWHVTDFSTDARVTDLEAVVAALGYERFALLGMSNGSGVALAYAARHPDRVTRLILNGTVCGERPTFDDEALGRGTDLSEPDPSRLGARGPRLSASLHVALYP